MDDPTVNWSEERYQECRSKLEPFLKRLGFNLQRDVHFMPCSGFTGAFLRDPPLPGTCTFYNGPTFLEFLGSLPAIPRNTSGSVRLPILARFSEMGTCVVGKLERGTIAKNATLTLMPNRTSVQVSSRPEMHLQCSSVYPTIPMSTEYRNVIHILVILSRAGDADLD